jgi:RNA polymerase sigma-70 factor (ECF subfamily)
VENAFLDFLRRLRSGDPDAAAALVREYEPLIRREVRLRLTDPRLHRLFDSADISQSVLRSFFARAAAGLYELARPQDLGNLLVAMAHNKVASKARRLRRRAADRDRIAVDRFEQLEALVDPRPGPAQRVVGRDLLEAVGRRLTPEERRLADLRARGCTWAEISAALGGGPEARRKQLARAVARVLEEMGLDEV